MPRRRTPELMDDPAVDRGELSRALGYLRNLNRSLGGAEALIAHLSRWSSRWARSGPITLLDIGTGSGDVPLAAVRWARARGHDLRATGVDLHETTCDLAREHVDGEVEIIRADALTLVDRFGPASFDYVHAGLFLHHLSDIEAMTMLKAMDRVARRGIVWNDLVRSPLCRVLVRVATVRTPVIFRHDARVSERAGFTSAEALDMARRVGIDGYCRYRRSRYLYRFTLAGEKPEAWA